MRDVLEGFFLVRGVYDLGHAESADEPMTFDYRFEVESAVEAERMRVDVLAIDPSACIEHTTCGK